MKDRWPTREEIDAAIADINSVSEQREQERIVSEDASIETQIIWSIGAVVRLASGGPKMTVSGSAHDRSRPGDVEVTWFDQFSDLRRETFPGNALVSAQHEVGSG